MGELGGAVLRVKFGLEEFFSGLWTAGAQKLCASSLPRTGLGWGPVKESVDGCGLSFQNGAPFIVGARGYLMSGGLISGSCLRGNEMS